MTDDERTLTDLSKRVEQAQEALMAKVSEDPDRWWEPRSLRKATRNGSPQEVMMFALTDLVNSERLELDAQLRVRERRSP